MSVYLKIHEEFMKLSRTVKAFAGTYGVPISVAETHLLREVASRRAQMAKDLAVTLGVDKGTVSRLVAGLVRRKLLKEKTMPSDRRSKVLALTREGDRLFHLTHERGNKFIGALSRRLTKEEQQELLSYFREFSDKAKAAPALFSADQHFLRPELRRFIRIMGFMKARFPKTSLSLTQKEILAAIRRLGQEHEVSANDVANAIGIESSNLSTMLASLEKRSLIARRKSQHDSRRQCLLLTPQGEDELNAFESELVSYFKKMFQGIPSDKCERLALLLARFSDSEGVEVLTQVVQNRIELRELKAAEELQHARATLVEELVREKKHPEIPERLFASNGSNFALFEEELAVGFGSVIYEGRGQNTAAELQLFWVAPRIAGTGADLELLKEILGVVFESKTVSDIKVTAKDAMPALKKLGAIEQDGKVVINRAAFYTEQALPREKH